MANEKQYAQWIDLPNGSDGYDRKWLKDAQAQQDIADIKGSVMTSQDAVALFNTVFNTNYALITDEGGEG